MLEGLQKLILSNCIMVCLYVSILILSILYTFDFHDDDCGREMRRLFNTLYKLRKYRYYK